jgi:hypothetical protein
VPVSIPGKPPTEDACADMGMMGTLLQWLGLSCDIWGIVIFAIIAILLLAVLMIVFRIISFVPRSR